MHSVAMPRAQSLQRIHLTSYEVRAPTPRLFRVLPVHLRSVKGQLYTWGKGAATGFDVGEVIPTPRQARALGA